ncbi:hypothetical protein CLV30_12882 [Haloactinopolyspora alba]|uniref:Uncharacterized protein n=1 Tax=Haloactinopolyspora alba TaxID=648780 RepID=A0A2P8DF48_9ACTN|nr:hypothetical protein [Haloactinopolyspora alba]PSK95830.1 hypothetical protein CLV30_12882 [Haloactinopolyspora alba]
MTTSQLPAGWDRYVRPCQSCGRPILWAFTEQGSRRMLDPALDDQGNQAVVRDGTGTLRARQLSTDRPVPDGFEKLMMPHVVTCPKAPGRTPPPESLPPNVVPLDRARRRPK